MSAWLAFSVGIVVGAVLVIAVAWFVGGLAISMSKAEEPR